MSRWLLLLGGLIVWTAHFFVLYGIASVLPGTQLAHRLTLIATVPALAADAILLWGSAARKFSVSDDLDRWILDLAAAGAALSFVAVLWQALPALTV